MKILLIGAYFPRPNNPTMGTWALSQAIALQAEGNRVQIISPIPAVPLIVSRLLRRGSAAACPERHRWDGIDEEALYIRWPIYPMGPIARLMRLNPRPFLDIAWALTRGRFLKIARSFVPDVIFAHHGRLGGYLAFRLAQKLRVPYFVCEHENRDIDQCADHVMQKRFYSHVLKSVSAWIAVSDRMGASMRRIFPDIPQRTIHNGADNIPDELAGVPRPENLAGKLVVLCIAFFYQRKNIPLLVKAFDRIAGRHPNAIMVIGGDGDDMPQVTDALAAARYPSQVMLLGRVSHRDALQYMIWCDVFALLGVNEPFGVVFAEAMMAGKPIIYANDCGIGDLAKHEVHGLAVLPNDEQSAAAALDRMLTEKRSRVTWGAAALALAQSELKLTTNASQLTRMFQSAL